MNVKLEADLQGKGCIITYGTLTPLSSSLAQHRVTVDRSVVSYGSINELVSVSRILMNLLDSSCSRALDGYHGGLTREQGFVLQVLHA